MAETYYAWDPVFDCILDETEASGAIVAEYTQEPRPYGGLISQKRGGTTSYYHYDPVGTTRALTNQAQAVTDTAVYTAFGEKITSTGTTVNPFGYAGSQGYCATGVSSDRYIVRHRIYSGSQARWSSLDSLKADSAGNHFRYCGNSPTTKIDPSGLIAQIGINGGFKPRIVPKHGWNSFLGVYYFHTDTREEETVVRAFHPVPPFGTRDGWEYYHYPTRMNEIPAPSYDFEPFTFTAFATDSFVSWSTVAKGAVVGRYMTEDPFYGWSRLFHYGWKFGKAVASDSCTIHCSPQGNIVFNCDDDQAKISNITTKQFEFGFSEKRTQKFSWYASASWKQQEDQVKDTRWLEISSTAGFLFYPVPNSSGVKLKEIAIPLPGGGGATIEIVPAESVVESVKWPNKHTLTWICECGGESQSSSRTIPPGNRPPSTRRPAPPDPIRY